MFNFTPPKITAGNALKGVAIATLLTIAGAASASADVVDHKGHNHAKSTIGNSIVMQMASADRDSSSNRRERRRDDRRTDRRRDRDDRRSDRRRDRDRDLRRDRRREYRPTYRRTYGGYGYRPRSSTYGYRGSNGYHGYRGYRTNYRSGLGISFHFGTPGYSNYRWVSSPYSGYRSSYGSYSRYRSQTYCQRVTVEGWHHGHRELVSVKQCSNPWDGTYIVQGSERLLGCRG